MLLSNEPVLVIAAAMKKCLRLLVVLFFSMNDMPTMTQSQHLALRWLNLQNEATHTQDEGFGKDNRDQE